MPVFSSYIRDGFKWKLSGFHSPIHILKKHLGNLLAYPPCLVAVQSASSGGETKNLKR